MTIFAATDFTISVNAVNLTDHADSLTTSFDVAELTTTAFGDDWTSVIGGLKSGSVAINFHQDFAAASVDATLWAAFGTVVEVIVKPTSAAVSATNPSYTFDVLVTSTTPIAASVGDLATQSITWPVTGAAVRAVS
jgi:hypothetical protein